VSNICIIPARGGSQRIPRKNKKLFCGRPIIEYPIQVAKESGLFDRIVVSTDDLEIGGIAIENQVDYFKRSDDYALPDSPMVESVLEVVEADSEEYATVCMMYACNPFVKVAAVQQAYRNHETVKADVTTAVYRSAEHAEYSLLIEKDRLLHRHPEYKDVNSDEFPHTYQSAGQFYIADVIHLQMSRTLAPQNMHGVIVDEGIDIDTPDDWTKAEAMYILQNHPKLMEWAMSNTDVIAECSAMSGQWGTLNIRYADGAITAIDRSITVRKEIKPLSDYDG